MKPERWIKASLIYYHDELTKLEIWMDNNPEAVNDETNATYQCIHDTVKLLQEILT